VLFPSVTPVSVHMPSVSATGAVLSFWLNLAIDHTMGREAYNRRVSERCTRQRTSSTRTAPHWHCTALALHRTAPHRTVLQPRQPRSRPPTLAQVAAKNTTQTLFMK
jgi:hypothetical protein